MLFIDIKSAFIHILKEQLLTPMIEFRVDSDFVTRTGSFFIKRKVQLVIDRHDNKEKEIDTGIP